MVSDPPWVKCLIWDMKCSAIHKCISFIHLFLISKDIHMELPYGTLSDDEMRQLNIPALQDEGLIFLWVTGRYGSMVYFLMVAFLLSCSVPLFNHSLSIP